MELSAEKISKEHDSSEQGQSYYSDILKLADKNIITPNLMGFLVNYFFTI